MDPLSAIGVASAIVAIIDFSWKLVTGTCEIYHSMDGVTADNARLEDVTGRLEYLMQELRADTPIKTTAEKNTQHLAKKCKEDAQMLRALLIEMRAPAGRRRLLWKSLNAKWKSILNKREVAQLKTRIQDSRADVQMNLLAMLKEDQSAIGLKVTNIEQDYNELKTGQPRQLKKLHSELLNSLKEHDKFIRQQLQDMQQSITILLLQHRILPHILPDEIGSRQDEVPDADHHKYCWILEPAAPYARQIRVWTGDVRRLHSLAEGWKRRPMRLWCIRSRKVHHDEVHRQKCENSKGVGGLGWQETARLRPILLLGRWDRDTASTPRNAQVAALSGIESTPRSVRGWMCSLDSAISSCI